MSLFTSLEIGRRPDDRVSESTRSVRSPPVPGCSFSESMGAALWPCLPLNLRLLLRWLVDSVRCCVGGGVVFLACWSVVAFFKVNGVDSRCLSAAAVAVWFIASCSVVTFFKVDGAGSRCVQAAAAAVVVCGGFFGLHFPYCAPVGASRSGGPCSPCLVWCVGDFVSVCLFVCAKLYTYVC